MKSAGLDVLKLGFRGIPNIQAILHYIEEQPTQGGNTVHFGEQALNILFDDGLIFERPLKGAKWELTKVLAKMLTHSPNYNQGQWAGLDRFFQPILVALQVAPMPKDTPEGGIIL